MPKRKDPRSPCSPRSSSRRGRARTRAGRAAGHPAGSRPRWPRTRRWRSTGGEPHRRLSVAVDLKPGITETGEFDDIALRLDSLTNLPQGRPIEFIKDFGGHRRADAHGRQPGWQEVELAPRRPGARPGSSIRAGGDPGSAARSSSTPALDRPDDSAATPSASPGGWRRRLARCPAFRGRRLRRGRPRAARHGVPRPRAGVRRRTAARRRVPSRRLAAGVVRDPQTTRARLRRWPGTSTATASWTTTPTSSSARCRRVPAGVEGTAQGVLPEQVYSRTRRSGWPRTASPSAGCATSCGARNITRRRRA